MSNLNVGGIEGDLVLNTRQWIEPGREALSSLRNLGSTTTTILDGMERASEETFRDMGGRLRDAQGRFVAFGDGVRRTARDTGQSFRGLNSDINTGLKNIRDTCRDISQNISFFARTMRQATTEIISSFAQFDQQMRGTDAIAKLSAKGLEDLGKSVRKMRDDLNLGQGPNTLAAGLKQIAGAGYNSSDSLDILKEAALAADAGETTTAVFAQALTPTIKDYGLQANQARLVTDQLFRAIDQGNLSAEDLATQFGSIAPVAAAAGVSLQELSGAFALMSTKGQSASENATQLRSVINHLQSPAVDAQKLLDHYGVAAGEAAIRTKGLAGVIKELFEKTGGNKIALKRILDDEGMQAAIKLMGTDAGKGFQDAIANQFSADGATLDARDRISKSLVYKTSQAKAALENFRVGAGSGLEPVLTPIADGLNKVTSAMVRLPDSTKAAIAAVTGLVAAGATLMAGLTLLAPQLIQIGTWVANYGGVARVATTAVQSIGAAFSATRSVILTLASPVSAITAGFRLVTSAAATVTQGMVGVTAAVAEVVAPIAAAVAVVATLRTAWDRDWGGIREFVQEVVTDIRGAVATTGSTISQSLGPVASQLAQDFREGWPYVRQFFVDLAHVTVEIAIPAVRNFYQVARDVFSGLVTVVRTSWGIYSPIIRLMGDTVRDMVGVVALALDGDWNAAWNAAVASVANLGPRIKSALSQVIVNIQDGLAELGQKIRQAITDALSGNDVTRGNSIVGMDLVDRVRASMARAGGVSFLAGSAASTAAASITNRAFTSRNQIGGGPGLSSSEPPPPTGRTRKGPSAEELKAEQIASAALSRAGGVFPINDPNAKAQCANFVRDVFAKAGTPIGVSSKPIDYRQTMGQEQGASYANSFFGKDVGKLVTTISDLKKGDVVGFRNTYGNYAPGTITHAGIYVGNGKFTHRPTAGAPVRTDSLSGYWGGQFAGGVRPFALGKGGSGMGQSGISQEEVTAGWVKLEEFLGKTNNAYQTQRTELQRTYREHMALAKQIGDGQGIQLRLKEDYARKVSEVNDAERRDNMKTLNELTVTRLEAEGKLGEAARARIAATAEEEKASWQERLKQYPQMAEQIGATMKAIDENAQRQQEQLTLQQGGQRVQNSSAASEFALKDPGMGSLIQAFPQFRAEVESAYAAVQRYIQNPAEATRVGFENALQSIDQLTAKAAEAQQRKLQDVEFERALGQISKEEALARQGEILNNWIGGEETKRQAVMQYSELFREHLQQQLEQQGEFNLAAIEQLAESLHQAGELTLQQQGQLIAANQLVEASRVSDQQGWMQVLQQSEQAFSTFLQSVASGQQTFAQAFKQMWKSIAQSVLAELSRMIAKAMALFILQKAIGFFTGGASEVVGQATNLLSIPGLPIAHAGGVLSGSGSLMDIPRFHSGSFAGPRFSSAGLRSDEYLAVLQTQEAVLNRSQTRALLSGRGVQQPGGRTVNFGDINIHNTINNEMDIDYVSHQLGRRITASLQGVG